MIAYTTRRCAQTLLTCAGLLVVAAFVATGGGPGGAAGGWLGHALRLDFGRAADGTSVAGAIAAALPASAVLVCASLAITLLFGWGGGLLLGIARAEAARTATQHGVAHRIAHALCEGLAAALAIAQGVPVFWLGGLLIAACSVGAGWLPPGGIASPDLPAFATDTYRLLLQSQPATIIQDLLAHLALPALSLSLAGLATSQRLIGAALPAELRTPHAAVARAAGLTRSRLLRRAMRPVLPVALAGSTAVLPVAISALVLVEYLFGWPGIGLLAYQAAREGDTETLAALLLCLGLPAIVIDLVADLLSAWADPRLRMQGTSR